jgi:hypothetical protein
MLFEFRPPPYREIYLFCCKYSFTSGGEQLFSFSKLLSVVILHFQWYMFEDGFAIAIAFIV